MANKGTFVCNESKALKSFEYEPVVFAGELIVNTASDTDITKERDAFASIEKILEPLVKSHKIYLIPDKFKGAIKVRGYDNNKTKLTDAQIGTVIDTLHDAGKLTNEEAAGMGRKFGIELPSVAKLAIKRSQLGALAANLPESDIDALLEQAHLRTVQGQIAEEVGPLQARLKVTKTEAEKASTRTSDFSRTR